MTREEQEMAYTVLKRLEQYKCNSPEVARRRLVALWRAAFPEAAAQPPSGIVNPFVKTDWRKREPKEPDEIWVNDVYHVTLRRVPDRVFGSDKGMVQLGINTHDGTARHDWREFQQIKNMLAGPECEAFELYPAESRLLDPSNYYTLWCFPGVRRIKVGQELHRVWDADQAMAAQREFSK